MKYERKPSFDTTFNKLLPLRKRKAKEAIRKKDRILFRLKGSAVEFTIVGNHGEIKRHLKNV